jgi:tRNA(Ile)-lysidine synthase
MALARRVVRQLIRSHFPPGVPRHFLVAVSGGADSLALAWAAAFALPRLGHSVEAVVIDHGLQDGSAEVAQTAAHTVESFGLPVTVVRVRVGRAGGVESAARDARYGALSTRAETVGASGVLLGHTRDDQAETVLLGLVRGSGPGSIRGMAEVSGLWLRPFLAVTRAETEAVCRAIGVNWWDDPHNIDPRFVRPRLRHEVMPLLRDVAGPGIDRALAQTAQLVSADDDYLNAVARTQLNLAVDPATPRELSASALADQPDPIRTRMIRLWVADVAGHTLTMAQVNQVDALVVDWKGQGEVALGGAKLRRDDGVLRLSDPTGHNPGRHHTHGA